jgi:pimeloyl-ACP methyl ester carboxylesterase
MHVDTGGVKIHFDVDGVKEALENGVLVERPTVVMIHGGPGSDHHFCIPIGRPLTELAQVVYIDLRGHGKSDRSSPEHWNLQTWADDVAGLCHALGIHRPIVLGFSFGGFVAQALAIRHPECVGRLMLCSTSARIDPALVEAAFRRRGGDAVGSAAAAFLEDPTDPARADRYRALCLPLYSTSSAQFGLQSLAGGRWDQDIFDWYARPVDGEFHTADFSQRLVDVTAPTVIIAGALDPITPPEAAQSLHNAFAPGIARLEVLDGASHTLYLDAERAFFDLLRSVVQEAAAEVETPGRIQP